MDDGISCTTDSCDEINDVVVNAPDNGSCDNGQFCDGPETCDLLNDCQAGTPPVVDDGVGCTADSCDEVNDVVVNAPDDGSCDNGQFCDGAETCDPINDCQSGSAPCQSGESCNEVFDICGECLADADCDNGQFCDGVESCDGPTGTCQPGTPPVVEDGISCTADSCDEVNDVVVNTPDDGSCGNGQYCDGVEICDALNDCQAGAPPVVDDGVSCTTDSCDEVNDVVTNTPDDAACDNGQFCDGAETCDPINDCQSGSVPCQSGESCDEVLDACSSGCGRTDHDFSGYTALDEHWEFASQSEWQLDEVNDNLTFISGYADRWLRFKTPNPSANHWVKFDLEQTDMNRGYGALVRCGPAVGDTCYYVSQYFGTVYWGRIVQRSGSANWDGCDTPHTIPGSPFGQGDTMAVSVEGTGASTVLKIWRNPFGECPADWGPADWQFEDCGSCCIDGDNRFSGISAWGGQTPIVHTFDNYAQSDVAVVGCATDADCDNGQFCDGAETCDPINDCQPGTPPVVDDGVSCTTDSCDEVNDVVINAPDDGSCDNGQFCDGAETCDPINDCQSGSAPCQSGESCNEVFDICGECLADADCDNGQFCDGVESCDGPTGTCQPGTPPIVEDGISCTADSCDEVNDVVVNTPDDGSCDNGQFCDGAETCDALNDCQTGAPPVVDDGVSCTTDSCDEVNDVVVSTPDDGACDNGQFCDGAETCDPTNDCQSGSAPCQSGSHAARSSMCVGSVWRTPIATTVNFATEWRPATNRRGRASPVRLLSWTMASVALRTAATRSTTLWSTLRTTELATTASSATVRRPAMR